MRLPVRQKAARKRKRRQRTARLPSVTVYVSCQKTPPFFFVSCIRSLLRQRMKNRFCVTSHLLRTQTTPVKMQKNHGDFDENSYIFIHYTLTSADCFAIIVAHGGDFPAACALQIDFHTIAAGLLIVRGYPATTITYTKSACKRGISPGLHSVAFLPPKGKSKRRQISVVLLWFCMRFFLA